MMVPLYDEKGTRSYITKNHLKSSTLQIIMKTIGYGDLL